MSRNALGIVILALVALVILMATDVVSLSCDTNDDSIPEAIDDAADNVEDAAEELGGN